MSAGTAGSKVGGAGATNLQDFLCNNLAVCVNNLAVCVNNLAVCVCVCSVVVTVRASVM